MSTVNLPVQEFDEKFLTCPVCTQLYKDPRKLPYCHTFCANCLKQWQKEKGKSKFTCPSCQVQVKLAGGDVKYIPSNTYISKLLELKAQRSSKKPRASCGVCESAASIEGTCGDCKLLLYGRCLIGHGSSPAQEDHSIITLKDLKNTKSRSKVTQAQYCLKHKKQAVTFYCQPCAKLVCRDCTVTEHQLGPNYDQQEVSMAAQKCKAELQALVEKTQATADTLVKSEETVTRELMSITVSCKTVKEEVHKYFSQLRMKLNKEEDEVIDELLSMEVTDKKPFEQEKRDLAKTLQSSKDGLKSCTNILARDNDGEILTLRKQLQDRLTPLSTAHIQHEALKTQIVFKPTADPSTINFKGHLSRTSRDLFITEAPVESVPTTVVIGPLPDQVWKTNPQVVVTSPWGQCNTCKLDTTRTTEGMFEAVWRPQTSGKHVVGVIAGEGGGGEISRGGDETTGGATSDEGGASRVGATGGCENTAGDSGTVDEGLKMKSGGSQTAEGRVVDAEGVMKREEERSCSIIASIPVHVSSNNPVLRFGSKGSQWGKFNQPIGVAVRGDRLYVADTYNERIQVFDMSGDFCDYFPTFALPGTLAIQSDGNILASCKERVMKFSPVGEHIDTFYVWDYCTKHPYGLAVQLNGRFIVTDVEEHIICLFEADGAFVKKVGEHGKGEGQFDQPCFVCVDGEDNVIVTDNHRVQVFDKDLNFKQQFGKWGRRPQDMWCPMGVASDRQGNIVLANVGGTSFGWLRNGMTVQVFRPDGTWVSTISSDKDKLEQPQGVAVTEDGHVFVVDSSDHCIRKYRYM